MSHFRVDQQRARLKQVSPAQHGQFMPSQFVARPTPTNTGLKIRMRATMGLQKPRQEGYD